MGLVVSRGPPPLPPRVETAIPNRHRLPRLARTSTPKHPYLSAAYVLVYSVLFRRSPDRPRQTATATLLQTHRLQLSGSTVWFRGRGGGGGRLIGLLSPHDCRTCGAAPTLYSPGGLRVSMTRRPVPRRSVVSVQAASVRLLFRPRFMDFRHSVVICCLPSDVVVLCRMPCRSRLAGLLRASPCPAMGLRWSSVQRSGNWSGSKEHKPIAGHDEVGVRSSIGRRQGLIL